MTVQDSIDRGGSKQSSMSSTPEQGYQVKRQPWWSSSRALSTISVVVFLAVWQFVTSTGLIEPVFLASPTDILRTAYQQFFLDNEIYTHIRVSLTEAVIGFAMAIVVGVFLGLAMGRFDRVRHVFEPFVMALYSTPSVALLPLFILWLGIGLWSKVLIVFLGGVFAILVNTIAGVRGTNPRLIETARAFTASQTEVFLYIILPAAIPFIVAGIRLAIGRVLISVFVAELYMSNEGVGFLITQAGATYNTALMLMGILLFTLTGMGLSQSLSFVEDRYLTRFREH
ncbi:MAG: ABC transporter permease [Pseudolabrys sp.]